MREITRSWVKWQQKGRSWGWEGTKEREEGEEGGEKYNVKILFENAIMKLNFLKDNKMKTKKY